VICNLCWQQPAAFDNGLCVACDAIRRSPTSVSSSAPRLSDAEADNAYKAAQLRGVRPPPPPGANVCQWCAERPAAFPNRLCAECDQTRRASRGEPGSGAPLTAAETEEANRLAAVRGEARSSAEAPSPHAAPWFVWGFLLAGGGAAGLWIPYVNLSPLNSVPVTTSVSTVAGLCWSRAGSFVSALSGSVARTCDIFELGQVMAIGAIVVGGILVLIGLTRASR